MASLPHDDAVAWRWRAATIPAGGLPLAATVVAAAAAGSAHLFAARPAGNAVAHLAVDGDGLGTALPDLPLASVSGAAAGPDGLLVAGAGPGGTAPALCLVEAGTGAYTPVDLPASGPVAAWPVAAGGDPPWVVWATGGDSGAIHCAVLTGAGVAVRETIATPTPWTVQAVATGNGLDVLDVLAQTPAGTTFTRLGGDAPPAPELRSGALLSAGAVLTPAGGHRLHVWDTVTGASHELDLPEPPAAGSARADSPRLLVPSDLLVWSTRTPDTDARQVRVLTSRGWVARLDRSSWRVGPAAALPTGSPAAVALEDVLVVTGPGEAWIGTPSGG
jgi:hypothetical protein